MRIALLLPPLLLATPPLAAAQNPGPASLSSADSARLLKTARSAQARFESGRRAYLPPDHGGQVRCDERIGRFCYWYDPVTRPHGAEPAEVIRSREELLATLQSIAGKIPGDDWIAGQRVRYLVEQGRAEEAVRLGLSCRATGWWCAALLGVARHAMRDYPGADSAFRRALAKMPGRERCRWSDLSSIVADLPRSYRDLPCDARDSAGQRFWWLADPLYSVPGNERRTEHLARLAMGRILDRSATPHATSWGDDGRELLLRYGWPTWWTRGSNRPGELGPEPVFGYEPQPGYEFLPSPRALDPSSPPDAIDWRLDDDRARTRYSPPYAPRFGEISRVQFARFRRGDSTLSVAVFDFSADTLVSSLSAVSSRSARVVLAAGRDPSTQAAIGAPSSAALRGVAVVRSGWAPGALSLEARAPEAGWAARRRVVAGIEGPLLSDLMLLSPGRSLPDWLEGALAAALPVQIVARGGRVGLYWEIYDEGIRDASPEISVIVAKAGSHWDVPYPLGRSECLPRRGSAIALRWSESSREAPRRAGRSLLLDLSRLRKGRYEVGVEMRTAGGLPACTSREFSVVPGPD